MKQNNITKFSDFQKNEENPFLKQALEEVNKSVVKKYRSATGTDRKAVLQAIDPNTGELLGHTSFIRQIEVDEEQFTKFYRKHSVYRVFFVPLFATTFATKKLCGILKSSNQSIRATKVAV